MKNSEQFIIIGFFLETICITVVLHFTTCCKRALGIKQFKSPCYRKWDFCSLSLLRLSFCRPVKLQPLARWSKYIGSGFCRKNPISWLSLRQQARRKMERKSTPSLRRTLYTCRYAHAQNAVDAESLSYFHSPVLYQPVRSWRLMGTNDHPVGGALTPSAAPSTEAVWLENRTRMWKLASSPPCRCSPTHTHTHSPHA